MALPTPEVGLVIRYSYLWHHEAMRGQEEGQKDRPCVIVLAAKDNHVVVAPITHTPPAKGASALELPGTVKAQLGLDYERSWVVTNDVNYFQWPGPDVRPAKGQDWAFGTLPPGTLKTVLQKVREHARDKTLHQVKRDEAAPPVKASTVPPPKDWNAKPPEKPKNIQPLAPRAPKKDRDM